MSELEDMIGKILSDPGEMEKITKMASELFGGGAAEEEKASGSMDISKLLGRALKGSDESNKAALVAALCPYLKPQRRQKLEKALRISRLAGLAGLAMNEFGEANV